MHMASPSKHMLYHSTSELWRHLHLWVNCYPVLSRNMTSQVFSHLCPLQAFTPTGPLTPALCSTWTAGPLVSLSSAVRCTHSYMPMPTASCWSLQAHTLALTCSMHSDLCMFLYSTSHCTSLHSTDTCTHINDDSLNREESEVTCQPHSSSLDV